MILETINIKSNKKSQAINIPQSMRINDDKVYLKKVGNVLYIIPFHNPWQNFFDSIEDFTPDFMEDRAQPTNQNRASFD